MASNHLMAVSYARNVSQPSMPDPSRDKQTLPLDAAASPRAKLNSRRELERRVAERTEELAARTAELELAEKRFRAIVEASPVPLMLSRVQDGRILYVNDRLEELLGAVASDLVGKATPDFYYDPADRPGILTAVRGQGYVRDLELRIKRFDGTPRWVSLTVQPLVFDGEPALATALLDITERKEAEQVLRRQKALLEAQGEAAIDGTLVVSETGKILSYNERFIEMWDIPDDIVRSASDAAAVEFVLAQLEDPTEFAERIEYLYAHPEERARDEVRLRDGRVFDRYSAPVTGGDGSYYGRIWFFRDMTAQKRHAEELEQARAEAEAARLEASQYAETLENDLALGRRIQQGMLPAQLPEVSGWEIAVKFRPVMQVAGDFYDTFRLATGHVGFIIADVSGKGVGAALFMALFQSLLRASAERASRSKQEDGRAARPDDILREAVTATNDYITRVHRQTHMFASVVFGLLCPNTGTIRYINAGHEPPVIVSDDGPRERLVPTGPALGLMANARFEIGSVTLEPGEKLLAFTDGVTEARDGARGFFTDERLLSLLDNRSETAADLLNCIESSVEAFIGDAEPADDLTMLALRRTH